MAFNNFFKKFSDSINSRFLKYIIENKGNKLFKEQKNIYSACFNNLEVIIPEKPIENIEEFNAILEILEKFDGNSLFKQCLPVKQKAFSSNKSSIIGYSYGMEYKLRRPLSLDITLKPIIRGDFFYIIGLLEFVMFLTDNNISLEQCDCNDFLSTEVSLPPSMTTYYFYFPHKLKIVNELNPICNIKWFLKIIAPDFKIGFDAMDECNFDEYFFFKPTI